MVKAKFTAPDVRAMVRDLRTKVLGLKVINIYDLDNKTYTFKLAVPGGDKVTLLLESGIRFHTTAYARDRDPASASTSSSSMPNVFAMKLRKHLRGKSVEDVRQLGTDRVVCFKFGQGEGAVNVLLELYAGGNILVCDAKFEILALLRTHEYGEGEKEKEKEKEKGKDTQAQGAQADGGGASVSVGQIYPMALATNLMSSTATTTTTTPSSPPPTTDEEKHSTPPPTDTPTPTDTQPITGPAVLSALQARVEQEIATAAAAAAKATPSLPPPPSSKKKGGGGGGGGKTKRGGQAQKRDGGAMKLNLKMALMTTKMLGVSGYGPALIEHAILGAGLLPLQKLVTEHTHTHTDTPTPGGAAVGENEKDKEIQTETRFAITAEECERLAVCLCGLENVVRDLDLPGQQGYILCRREKGKKKEEEKEGGKKEGDTHTQTEGEEGKEGEEEEEVLFYEEFLPHVLQQHQQLTTQDTGKELRAYPSFDAAVDDFFAQLEAQKMRQAATAQEEAVKGKLTRIKVENEARLKELAASEERLLEGARLIELHSEAVDKALLVLRSAIATGADWATLQEYIKTEQAAGNALARMIVGAKWEENKIQMALEDPYAEDDDEEEEEEGEDGEGKKKVHVQVVDIDLGLSAYANSRALYEAKKKAADKAGKTVQGMEKALKVAERQAQASLNKQQLKRSLAAVRKVHWFEKFHWFISSDNYLVVSGRDAQQNEMLVKRYLREGDAYIHADVHGAASCIVRHKGRKTHTHTHTQTQTQEGGGGEYAPISPIALHEAGCFCVCRSAAWKAKMVTSAWWVHASQVSKMAPSGEYLTTGSFMIRGKKNFLAPHALEMGLAILFKVESAGGSYTHTHTGERRERLEGEEEEEGEGMRERQQRATAALVAQVQEEEEEEEEKEAQKAPTHTHTQQKKKEEEEESDDDEGWAVLDKPTPTHTHTQTHTQDNGPTSTPAQTHTQTDNGKKKEGGGGGGGGRLSAKERKLLKKGLTLEEIRKREEEHTHTHTHAQEEEDDEGEVDEDAKMGEEEDEEKVREGLQDLTVGGGSNNTHTDTDTHAHTQGSNKRGKKGKLKKMKKKYAEQDDEDRHLALQALGVLAKKDKDTHTHKKKGSHTNTHTDTDTHTTNKEASAKLATEMAQVEQAAWNEAWAGLPEWVRVCITSWVEEEKILKYVHDLGPMELRALAALPEEGQQRGALESFYKCVTGPEGRKARSKSAVLGREISRRVVAGGGGGGGGGGRGGGGEVDKGKENGEAGAGAGAGEEEKQQPISRRKAAKLEEEGMLALLQEEGVLGPGGGGDDDQKMEEEQRDLRRLTGTPHPTDLLLFAIPVCAPYSALPPSYYKYRVKLTPGTQKKGKAAHQALEVFIRDKDATPREIELLKAMNDSELVATILGEVKVSKPGLQSTLLQAKRSKAKAKAKQKKG